MSEKIGDYKIHPAAALFPMMSKAELKELSDDIVDSGQRLPVMLWRNQVIDGRNRLTACELAGVEPLTKDCTKEFATEEDVIQFVVSMNLKRRNLSSSERATIGVKMLPLLKKAAKERQAEGGKKKLPQIFEEAAQGGEATAQAAKLVGTNRQYIHDAEKISKEAPEQFEAIKRGEKTIPEVKRELKQKKSGIDAEIAAENRVIDSVMTRLASITKDLRKCIDDIGITQESRERVIGALGLIHDILV